MWTKDSIRAKLASDNVMVERSLLVLYNLQTTHERVVVGTTDRNNIGFNSPDAKFLSRAAVWVQKGITKQIPEGQRLSGEYRDRIRSRLLKYAGQLAIQANAGTKAPR